MNEQTNTTQLKLLIRSLNEIPETDINQIKSDDTVSFSI